VSRLAVQAAPVDQLYHDWHQGGYRDAKRGGILTE